METATCSNSGNRNCKIFIFVVSSSFNQMNTLCLTSKSQNRISNAATNNENNSIIQVINSKSSFTSDFDFEACNSDFDFIPTKIPISILMLETFMSIVMNRFRFAFDTTDSYFQTKSKSIKNSESNCWSVKLIPVWTPNFESIVIICERIQSIIHSRISVPSFMQFQNRVSLHLRASQEHERLNFDSDSISTTEFWSQFHNSERKWE